MGRFLKGPRKQDTPSPTAEEVAAYPDGAPYAICGVCDRAMDGTGCTRRLHVRNGIAKDVARYGDEPWWADIPGPPPEPQCDDCAVRLGEYHHEGCAMERCPHDEGQAWGDDCEVIEPDQGRQVAH